MDTPLHARKIHKHKQLKNPGTFEKTAHTMKNPPITTISY